jgi:hypothetical protein
VARKGRDDMQRKLRIVDVARKVNSMTANVPLMSTPMRNLACVAHVNASSELESQKVSFSDFFVFDQ